MVCIETGWCTRFRRRGGQWFAPRDLQSAYRAPSLFAQQMVRNGALHHLVTCDEDFDPTGSWCPFRSITYLCSHGRLVDGAYRLSIHDRDIDLRGIRAEIVVIDACDVIDQHPAASWLNQLHPYVRIVLGFQGRATNDPGSALRGRVFADLLLAGDPVGDAWINAVTQTAHFGPYGPYDNPAVIAIGDTTAEAKHIAWAADIDEVLRLGPRGAHAVAEIR